jgi:hypothetical protein
VSARKLFTIPARDELSYAGAIELAMANGARNGQRADWQIALAVTVALRVFYSCVAAVAAVIVHPDARLIQSNALVSDLPAPHGIYYAWLGIWQRFDTLWYLHNAAHGYDLAPSVVYYPLYPWLIRGLGVAIGPLTAALAISTVAAFFYFWGVLRLARDESADVSPMRTLILTAVWPASFFFFAGYTEALAIALIVWAVIFARDERWALAAVCALAAGLTRSAGTLAVVPLAVTVWRGRGMTRWLVAMAPLGTLGYWLWLKETGRPSVAEAYRMYWTTEVAAPWTTLWRAIRSLVEYFDPLVAVSLVALILFFVAGVLARRRTEDRWFSFAVIVHFLLRSCWPPLLGAPRYLLPIYPAFLTMGEWAKMMEQKRFVFLCAGLFAFNLAWMWAFLKWSLVL